MLTYRRRAPHVKVRSSISKPVSRVSIVRILVTGGSGFIGAGVVKVLADRGDHVTAFDIARTARLDAILAQHANAEFVQGEITEWPHVMAIVQAKKPDAVVHCAAIVGVTNSLASPIGTFRVNVEGSLNVFEAMRLSGVRRAINLSSEETYGVFESDRIDETHPNRPLKPYGISKYAVERLACDYASAYGLEIIHVRTCWVYGPGLPRPRVPKIFVDAAVAGRKLQLPGGGDFRVDHVYIDDCVDGIVKALDKPKHRYDAYHIATGEAPSLAEIAAIINELVPGADIAIGPGPYRFVDGTEALRKGALDITRARRELGYEPRYPIRQGLAAYVAAARAGRG
jgi:UDP-glucose 4-epimerase